MCKATHCSGPEGLSPDDPLEMIRHFLQHAWCSRRPAIGQTVCNTVFQTRTAKLVFNPFLTWCKHWFKLSHSQEAVLSLVRREAQTTMPVIFCTRCSDLPKIRVTDIHCLAKASSEVLIRGGLGLKFSPGAWFGEAFYPIAWRTQVEP